MEGNQFVRQVLLVDIEVFHQCVLLDHHHAQNNQQGRGDGAEDDGYRAHRIAGTAISTFFARMIFFKLDHLFIKFFHRCTFFLSLCKNIYFCKDNQS